ncbi:MAG: SsrA-binding protein SmpB [Candidatus Komeilibacteria bacterium]|nr:SsrA-binding protein SmpB [Candidatus Komeilibacteria bacterium]
MPTIAENKKALFDYQILEKIEAGIKLTGPEVKVVRAGQIDLKGAYVLIKARPGSNSPEAWLTGSHIPKYKKAGYSQSGYNPDRDRKLLLNKGEIAQLIGKTKQKSLTLIPLSVYTAGRLIKVGLGLGQGKKKFDKRETIKKREFDRKKQFLIKRG